MNLKTLREYCIRGMRVCYCMFIAWAICGYIFGYFIIAGWNNLDFLHYGGLEGNYVISELIIFGIIIIFMRMVFKHERKCFENKYGEHIK